jgi:acetyl-CoA carboxylase biotin carboxyl carrier protein
MTEAGAPHRDPATSAGDPPETETETDGEQPLESQGDLVELLRHNAVQLLAGVGRPPRALRIRAGEVSVDVEWPDESASTERVHSGDGDRDGGNGAAAPAPAPVANNGGPPLHYLTAPTVGTFYRCPKPGAPPFVEEGDTVSAGQQVAIVEAMKVMIRVAADAGGRVVEVCKGDGEPVEFGERLVALAADPAEVPS